MNTWIKQTGRRRFIYTGKVSELITHVKRFRGTRELVRDFGLIADLLGPRRGCFLFQLPPSFHYTPAELAAWAARIKASGAKRVWAYFNNDRDGYAIKNARELLRQLQIKAR